MDINPYKFEAPFEAREFARFIEGAQQQGTQEQGERAGGVGLVVLMCCWLDSGDGDALRTPNYWCHRLAPLVGTDTVFVACNRVGREGKTVFCGSSCVLDLNQPAVVGLLNKRQSNVLHVEFARGSGQRRIPAAVSTEAPPSATLNDANSDVAVKEEEEEGAATPTVPMETADVGVSADACAHDAAVATAAVEEAESDAGPMQVDVKVEEK